MAKHEDNKIVVLGLYISRTEADRAVDQFRASGFRASDISALMPSGDATKDLAFNKKTKAPEGATQGATAGVVLGGAMGWLAGIGVLAIPGVGPLVAAGPIMAMLAGVGVGGTVGAVSGALIGMGIPEYEAKKYEGRVEKGDILLSVHCDNNEWKDKAKRIFEKSGATDISSTTEASVRESSNPVAANY